MKKALLAVLVILMLTVGCVQMDEETQERLRGMFGEKFDAFIQQVTQLAPGEPPTAYIDSISPADVSPGEAVSFRGHGTDPDGEVVAYTWRSSLDGDLSAAAAFETSSLTAGTHVIYFKVQDDGGEWSERVQGRVTISAAPARRPVINSFEADPGTIGSGDASLLSWNVSGAGSVSIDHGVGSDVGSSGIEEVSPAATTTYTLTATNGAGSVTAMARVVVSAGAPTPSPGAEPVISFFTASPGSISSGGSSVLSWLVSGATAVVINHGVGNVGSAGSWAVSPGTSTLYTLTATNAAGSVSRTAQVLVSAAPPSGVPVIGVFSATPTSISASGSSILSWAVSNADTVTISYGGSVNPVGSSGSVVATPGSTTTYTLTATNAAGSVTDTVQVVVSGAPPPPASPVINSFTASPGSIAPAGSSTLSWSVTGATTVSIDHGVGSVGAAGHTAVSPGSTTTYTLTATSAGGSDTRQAQVVVSGGGGGGGDPFEQALFDEVNARRASQGVAALTRNSTLDQLCRDHSQFMTTHGLSHDGFGSRCTQAQIQIGAMACAENVLEAPDSWSASQVVDIWWGSAGHKANMLNPAYSRAGMGIATSGGRVFATQFFTD